MSPLIRIASILLCLTLLNITAEAQLSGNYTIDASQPTAANNFASFSDFTQALQTSGVSAAVVATVVPGSGPYNEQLVFDNISGTSSTNTITIKGNGETISHNPIQSDRRIVGINRTSYLTLDSLYILNLNNTYGYGIHIDEVSNHNTIRNCTIDFSAMTNNLSIDHSAGIVCSDSKSSASGNISVNYLTIENNLIHGGSSGGPYSGIIVQGYFASASFSNQNVIRNNEIRDFYQYGIYHYFQVGTQISGNNIHRPSCPSNDPVYGLYLFARSPGLTVEKNNIHHLFGTTGSTQDAFAIRQQSNDGDANNRIRIQNNLIHNIATSGSIYAFYNEGADHTNYYHNTVSLDDTTANSSFTMGFNFTFVVTGVDIRNNIISIARAGTGFEYGIYSFDSTHSITIDNNNIYVPLNGGATENYARFRRIMSTLADWQTMDGGKYGQNSIDTDPQFTSADIFYPMATGPDESGANVNVAEDYYGLSRDASPDMGAIEFPAPPCATPNGLSALYLGGDSAMVSATDNNLIQPRGWLIEYDTAGFSRGSGQIHFATQLPTMIDGLSPSIIYDYDVRAVCISGDTSMAASGSFNTFGVGLTALDHQLGWRAYPNPTKGVVTIEADGIAADNFQLFLHDLQGKLIYETSVAPTAGNIRYRMETEFLPKGMYLLRLSDGERQLNKKLLVQ